MDPATAKVIVAAFSMRKELKIITYTMIALLLIPVVGVILLTQEGINIVSGSLVTQNNSQTPQMVNVDIHDPRTGAVVDNLSGPGMWPVPGIITLEFGQPDLPYEVSHTGIDIADPLGQVGTPVAAFMAGKVTYAGTDNWGYGTHVIIDHGHGVTSLYGHMESLSVTVGQQVQSGTIIGQEGSTGWSTGPHVHFQIMVFGIPVNPRVFLAGNP
jgi:murein DD-endopeptidase MepM/ murein hydrolase activator NlpD